MKIVFAEVQLNLFCEAYKTFRGASQLSEMLRGVRSNLFARNSLPPSRGTNRPRKARLTLPLSPAPIPGVQPRELHRAEGLQVPRVCGKGA